jgi:hypothetical protein
MNTRNVDLWRKNYNEVKKIGNFIKDSSLDVDGLHKLPLITMHQKSVLHSRIKKLQKSSNFYLTKLKLIPILPLWHYDEYDVTTHACHKEFKYKDKMIKEAIDAYGKGFMIESYKIKSVK